MIIFSNDNIVNISCVTYKHHRHLSFFLMFFQIFPDAIEIQRKIFNFRNTLVIFFFYHFFFQLIPVFDMNRHLTYILILCYYATSLNLIISGVSVNINVLEIWASLIMPVYTFLDIFFLCVGSGGRRKSYVINYDKSLKKSDVQKKMNHLKNKLKLKKSYR